MTALVIDASVALKWVLTEAGSDTAISLLTREPDLLIPDFWLNEAANVTWLWARRGLLTPDEAKAAFDNVRDLIEPTPTAKLRLHDVALEIGLTIGHSPYDTLYVAFALAMGAKRLVVADAAFLTATRRHPDPRVATMVHPLSHWL